MKFQLPSTATEESCALADPLRGEELLALGSDAPSLDDVDWSKTDADVSHEHRSDTPAAAPKLSKPGHIHAIGGFRFLAALAVMIGHFRGRFGFGDFHAAFGGRGVSFFFVLSGFILTYVYHQRLTKSGILSFYFKRIIRLWPLHLACTIFAIWLIGLGINPLRLAVNGLLLQSWIPDAKWAFSYNGVSWSISTEMFFFLMFPLLLLGGQLQFWLKFTLVALISVSIVLVTQHFRNDPAIASQFDLLRIVHCNPIVRLVEFGLGMATAFLFLNSAARKSVTLAGASKNQNSRLIFDSAKELAAISSFVIFYFSYDFFRAVLYLAPGGGSILSVWYHFAGSSIIFALIIYVFAGSKGILARMMGTRLMNFLGEISYAFFLVHNIILIYHSKVDWSASGLNRWMLAPCLIAMVLGLAIWLHFVVEKPLRDAFLSCSKQGFRSAIVDAINQVFKFGLSKPGVACFVLCLGSWLAVRAQYTPLNLTPAMYETIFASNKVVRETRFGEHVRLMGCDVEAVNGGIELRFVWQKLAPIEHFRFTHIVNQHGEIYVVPRDRSSLFKNAELIQPFEETQFIPYELLAQGHQIGIGFHCPDINPETNKPFGSLPNNRSAPNEFKPRLTIVHPASLRHLKWKIRKLQRLAFAGNPNS